MLQIAKIYPRDIIALIVLVISLYLIYLGINSIVSGIVIMIVTYYFSKRVYEEGNPNGNMNDKIIKTEEKVEENKGEIEEIKKYMPKPLPPGEVIIKPIIS